MRKIILIAGIATACFALVACKNDGKTPSDDESFKVTFSAGTGAFADGKKSVIVKTAGDSVALPNAPVLDGNAFSGWYNGDIEFDASARFTQDVTFTARYVSGDTEEVYAALFDESSTVSIDIKMSDREWKKLNNDYLVFNAQGSKSPIYRMADSVTIGIDDGDGMLSYYYEEVGVRMKGNTSRHEFYNNDGFFRALHMKLSFKQTFDDTEDGYTQSELKEWTDDAAREARKDRMFAGMDKIDIKYNSTRDETYVREMYAMKLFRDNGVIAPNVTMCSVTALEKDKTKKNLGVYRIHEPIDETFIARNFDDESVGDLWKCTYTKTGPADMTNYALDERVGVENELKGKFYSYDKKTNKKKDKETGLRDFSSMIDFITAADGNAADYSAILDTDAFAKFEAVNYMLGNPDCIRNNYNNYYVYFRKSDGKAVIIPYDYDRCLGLTADWNPTGSASMYLEPYTRRIAANENTQYNPLYKNLICKGAPAGEGSVLKKYRADLLGLSDSVLLTADAFNAYKDKFKNRYVKYVSGAVAHNDLSFDSNEAGNVPYAEYVSTKLRTLSDNIDNYI